MGNNFLNSQQDNKDEKSFIQEYKIIQENKIYNIKLIKEEKNSIKKIKISISFVLNNVFYIYEQYINQYLEKEENENLEKTYQELAELIKKENIKILLNNKDIQFISLFIFMKSNTKTFKLTLVNNSDKDKLDEITKNYISLEKDFIELKKKPQLPQIRTPFHGRTHAERNPFIHHFYNLNNNNNNNNIESKKIDGSHITLDTYSSIWCMLKLNKIVYNKNNENITLNLVALGLGDAKIILINLSKMEVHQSLKTSNTVYSLAQFNNDNKYLISSISNGSLMIYKLKEDKYELFQTIEKPLKIKKGEINKVITLSDGNLATAERGALSIWKPKIEKGEKKFEFFKEIITDYDTCQLIEVNPQFIACAIYNPKLINVYKKSGDDYILHGQIKNALSHGSNSNGMTKINDNIFCSGGKSGFIYIVCVEPVQVIQKIMLGIGLISEVGFLHRSNDGFIFTSLRGKIFQLKIINDEDGNFIKLQNFDVIDDGANSDEPIITTNDGKIFYKQINENSNGKSTFFLTNYKIN